MTRICLNMIVKNEARVIRRCLESVRPWIHHWVIVDTGSSDGTQELVREVLKDVPGSLFERPWRDFGSNRSEAIELAAGAGDYLLFLDADEEWVVPEGFTWPELTGDAYGVTHCFQDLTYIRATLAATRLPWCFRGALHEYLDSPEAHRIEALPGPSILVRAEGARSADPEKYLKDAAVLEACLEREPGNARHTFYLAQSYRDAGQLERSLAVYERRIALGGWQQELWYSMLQVALLKARLGRENQDIMAAYLRAYQCCPARPETLGQLARHCRLRGDYHLAHLFAAQSLTIPGCPDGLFVDLSYAAWRNLDEYAVACYWTDRPREAARACRELLAGANLPLEERSRVEANLDFALTLERSLPLSP